MANMVHLLFLGSGTSYGVPVIGCDCAVCRSQDPRNRRTRASVLASSGDVSLLIDASSDLRQQMLRERISRVDAILVTHSHADHVLGFDDVRALSGLQKAPVPVYADGQTLDFIRRKYDYMFRDNEYGHTWNVSRLALNELNARAEIGGVSVMPVPILHGRRTILGYRIGKLAYLTDCNGVPEGSLSLLDGLDTLILGAPMPHHHPTHFSVPEALAFASRLKPRITYFTHLSHYVEHAAAEAALPSNVRLAYDGLRIEAPE